MTLNEKIIEILIENLGPAGESLFTTLCKAQNKDPADITKNDLDELSKGIYEDIRAIMGDDFAEKVTKKILMLKQ